MIDLTGEEDTPPPQPLPAQPAAQPAPLVVPPIWELPPPLPEPMQVDEPEQEKKEEPEQVQVQAPAEILIINGRNIVSFEEFENKNEEEKGDYFDEIYHSVENKMLWILASPLPTDGQKKTASLCFTCFDYARGEGPAEYRHLRCLKYMDSILDAITVKVNLGEDSDILDFCSDQELLQVVLEMENRRDEVRNIYNEGMEDYQNYLNFIDRLN